MSDADDMERDRTNFERSLDAATSRMYGMFRRDADILARRLGVPAPQPSDDPDDYDPLDFSDCIVPKFTPSTVSYMVSSTEEKLKTRFLFREWPRPTTSTGPKFEQKLGFTGGKRPGHGKYGDAQTPLWGETLHDFYRVSPIPEIPGYMLISTGSRLAEWAHHVGETTLCKQELEWAATESDPQLLVPYNILHTIKETEARIRHDFKLDNIQINANPGVAETQEDPFHPNNVPSGWPTVFFQLPRYLLPKTLIVHDPDDVLHTKTGAYSTRPRRRAYEQEDRDAGASPNLAHPTVKPRSIKEYVLESSTEMESAVVKERVIARLAWKKRSLTMGYYFKWNDIGDLKHAGLFNPDIALWVPYDASQPLPSPVLSIPTAHLYLSAHHKKGTGNHSVVHVAEWELPRALFEDQFSVICNDCVQDAVYKAIQDAFYEKQNSTPMDTSGTDTEPNNDLSNADGSSGTPFGGEPSLKFGLSAPKILSSEEITGHRRALNLARSTWDLIVSQSLDNSCPHRKGDPSFHCRPQTVKVRVCAKLSLEGDSHLASEANNYRRFQDLLFEHWTGYHVLPPIQDPTPVGAIVPQFYGYYAPKVKDNEDKNEEGKEGKTEEEGKGKGKAKGKARRKNERYLSPILLLEDVGRRVDPDQLSIDDRIEVFNLITRFHNAGWIHQSVAERNLMQMRGKITDSPAEAQSSRHWRFRLIDFGRSRFYGAKEQDIPTGEWRLKRGEEETSATSLFQTHQM